MDDDDAFLYGDDAPSADPNQGEEEGQRPNISQQNQIKTKDQVIQGTKEEAISSFPPLNLPGFLSASGTNHPGGEEKATLVTSVGPSKVPIPDDPALLPTTTDANVQSSISRPDEANQRNGSEQDAEAESDDAEGQEEEEEEEEEESEDDLDIILEGDTTQMPPTVPPLRPILSLSRTETMRDSPQAVKTFDQSNVTTEYKPLERTDFKPLEGSATNNFFPISSPPKNQPQQNLPSNNHNRLPTPENFPRPSTPPTIPAPDTNPPDLDVQNPVVRSGYDDKDGTVLMDFDFDSIPESEKGWKRPGAHVADWFNYGFDETTWKLYVIKQKKLRKEHGWSANPFASFATGNIQQAWDELPAEHRAVMMQTIMGNTSGPPVNNSHQRPMQPPMPPMMVMNPMMQGMEMGGYGMQGMQAMIGGGNAPMNGGINNSNMQSQMNDDLSRGIKQEQAGASENGGDASAHFGDEMDSREQHHDQHRMQQDQMRHMQHMQHMGMNPGFMPGMDLAAMFGNQDHPMFMNAPQFSGMMEMPQMQHMQHIPQMVGGRPMNMGMNQGMNAGVNPGGMNPGMGNQSPVLGGPVGGMVNPPGGLGGSIGGHVPSPGPVAGQLGNMNNGPPGPVGGQAVGASTPVIHSPAVAPVPGSAAHATTPTDSPRTSAAGASASGRGRARGARGRGNAQASAFLAAAAAAARGRGRAISTSNSTPPLLPVNSGISPGQTSEVLPQAPSAPAPASKSVSPAPQPVESPPERPATKPVSPLPSNVPTGPRRAAMTGAQSRGPRGTPGGYFDKDAAGGRGDEGLDYGGGGGESPREDRKSTSVSRRHSHRSEREKMEEDPRAAERNEERSVRARSKSRDKEPEEKESSHRTSRSKHRHRARSRSKEAEHRSGREKGGEKDKEESGGGHKSSRSSGGSRRSRRNRRNADGEDKDEEREGSGVGEERDKESHKDKDRSKDEDDQDGDYAAPSTNGSRKRKSKEDRNNRSKREKGE